MLRFILCLTLVAFSFVSVFAQTAPPNWAVGVQYGVNNQVSYNTSTYKCLQAHTSQVSWEPPNAASLWQLQSGGGGTNPNQIFADDFEASGGWTINADNADAATQGVWERGAPTAFYYQGGKQPGNAHGGANNLVTGRAANANIEQNNDVDGGATTVRSPAISLPSSGNLSLVFWYYFAHNSRAGNADYFRVRVIGASSQTVIFAENGKRTNRNAVWKEKILSLNAFAGQTIRLQFEAADNDMDSLIEAGVDDVSVTTSGVTANPGQPFPARFFAPYADVLLYPTFLLAQTASQTGVKHFTLAFVTAGNGCEAKWGGVIALSENFLVADINDLRANSGNVVVSFGGASGIELAQACSSVSSLQAQYQAVIDKYNLTAVDFDVEGAPVADAVSIDRRNKAIAGLQQNAASQNRQLMVSYTLAVLPSGLEQSGLNVLRNALTNGVNVSNVNIMAMDYGAVANSNMMGQNAIDAANSTLAQLQTVFTGRTPAQLRSMLGVTPMIGLNDVAPEVFTMSDAQLLLNYAQTQNFGRLSMWSMTRDKQCPNAPQVSPVCSGIAQQQFDFSNRFKQFTQ